MRSRRVFYDQLQAGDRVLLFGAIHTEDKNPHAAPEVLDPTKPTTIAAGGTIPGVWSKLPGRQHAGDWTPEKAARLRALVEHAHANGLWIRFYTLDGAPEEDLSCNGWFRSYNFGSFNAARTRWRAAIEAHVDYIASDQYELLAKEIRESIHEGEHKAQ